METFEVYVSSYVNSVCWSAEVSLVNTSKTKLFGVIGLQGIEPVLGQLMFIVVMTVDSTA